jgi:hypothetical protein
MPNAVPEINISASPQLLLRRGKRRNTERNNKKFVSFAIFNKKASIPQFQALFA